VIPPITEIAQQRTVRLIPTAYYKPPVLRALVDSDEEMRDLAKLDGLTSKRLINAIPTVGLDYDVWGRTFISAAFTYFKKGGNRFNGETSGAWYAAFDDRTSLHEVAFHKTRELAFIDYFHDEVQYRALHASFIGRFHDLRSMAPVPDCLHSDPAIGYPHGQSVARDLIAKGSRGLIYPSVRNAGGVCLVAFQPNVVQDLSPGACWKITWDGTPKWTATTA
jgi:hypothetical protein